MTPINFTLTADDVLAGNRLAIRRSVRKGAPRFGLAILAMTGGITMLAYAIDPQPIADVAELFIKVAALYTVVAIVLLAFLLLVMPRLRAKKNIAQMPALSRQQTVSWDDTGIAFASDYGNATIPFVDLYQWAADDQMLILYPADHLFYFVSRQIVTDSADWDRLIAAIKRAGIKQI
jgi:hypothetical protein